MELDKREVRAVLLIMERHLEELAETKEAMIADPTILDITTFVELFEDQQDLKDTIVSIRKKVADEFWN